MDKVEEKSDPLQSVESVDAEARNVDDLAGTIQTNQALLWRRDIVLVPVLGLLYVSEGSQGWKNRKHLLSGLKMIMFLDRTNIANAKIEGMPEDLNMPDNGYGIALSLFYIPFVLAEVPSNLLLNTGKIPPNYYLGAMTFTLGE